MVYKAVERRVVYKAVEAELWGVHTLLRHETDLTVTRIQGTAGVEYEIISRTIWRSLRLHAILSALPPTARYQCFEDDFNLDEASDGVLVLHYWEDASDRARTPIG